MNYFKVKVKGTNWWRKLLRFECFCKPHWGSQKMILGFISSSGTLFLWGWFFFYSNCFFFLCVLFFFFRENSFLESTFLLQLLYFLHVKFLSLQVFFKKRSIFFNQHYFCHFCFLFNMNVLLWKWTFPNRTICSIAVILSQTNFIFRHEFFLPSPFLNQNGYFSSPSKRFYLLATRVHFSFLK